MEQRKGLASLTLVIILQGTMAQLKHETNMVRVDDNREDGSVLLTCNLKNKNIQWFKDGNKIESSKKSETLNLGSSIMDPRGMYWCKGDDKESRPLQVYFRMCQNCIELNAATVTGFIFAEIISIFFLALGVYFVAGQDRVHQSRASDKQTLLPNDQLYQPLKDREDNQYSHLQGNQLRKK